MDTIKIGTSENCDIKFYGKDITSSVWATISASDKKMLVLKILANNVRCFVNNNNVVDQYWIKYGDEICINDYTLDWNRINDLLHDDEKISNWERYLKYATSIQLDIEKVLMVGHSDERAVSIIFSSESNAIYVYDNMPLPPQTMQYKIDVESMACSPRKTIQLPSTYNQYNQLINHLMKIKCESVIEPSIYAVDTAPDIFYRVRLHIDMPGYDEPMLYIDTEISHQYETKWSTSIFSLINVLMSHLPDSNTEIKRIVSNLGIQYNSETQNNTDAETFLNNRYKLIRIIGEGGYGVIWLACDTFNNKEIAIKIYRSSLPSDIVERARREYSLGMRFSHPNVLPTYDFNQDGKYPYIIMPYCSFGSIEKLAGNIPEWTIWRVIKDIASGLEHLHQHRIMHLDIKPANFLLDSQGNYVLSDFGLSHRLADLIHRYDKNITVGGAAYMSPERFAPNTRIDTYSDIWSLGVSIYELVTGELPFHGWGGQQQLCDRILSLQCDKCSKKLSNLIDACINPHPQNRPSATEIIALADSIITGNDNAAPLFEIISDYTDFRKEHSFYNTYNEIILNAMKRYKIAKSKDSILYGIVDNKGNIIVDFLYDEIHNIGEFCWPDPGPLPPPDRFFIGAFFRQGDDSGYLFIKEDGSITEYKRCSHKEFIHRCQLT